MVDYRKAGREARKRLLAENHREYSTRICAALEPMLLPKHTVLLYMPIDGEVDITPLREFLLKNKTIVLFPSVRGDVMIPVRSGAAMKKGMYGIEEPLGDEFCDEIEVAVIPMCAFDGYLNRAGFGKGYYDRFLQHRKIQKFGVAFSCQKVEKLPEKPTDIKMDRIITENEILGV